MDTKSKRAIKKKLQLVGISDKVCKYFLESLAICSKKKIHILDLNLTRVLYPELAKKFKKAPGTIEKEMITELGDMWKDMKKREKFVKSFNYESRPSIKKFLIMLSHL